jgi:hypothetical protein
MPPRRIVMPWPRRSSTLSLCRSSFQRIASLLIDQESLYRIPLGAG